MQCELERHSPFILRLRDIVLWVAFVLIVGGILSALAGHIVADKQGNITFHNIVEYIVLQALVVVVAWRWADSFISNWFYWPKWDKEQKRKADAEAYQTKLLGRLEKDLTAREATKASDTAMKEKVDKLERMVGNLQALNETLIEDIEKLKKG
jgi:hypothetical protein